MTPGMVQKMYTPHRTSSMLVSFFSLAALALPAWDAVSPRQALDLYSGCGGEGKGRNQGHLEEQLDVVLGLGCGYLGRKKRYDANTMMRTFG